MRTIITHPSLTPPVPLVGFMVMEEDDNHLVLIHYGNGIMGRVNEILAAYEPRSIRVQMSSDFVVLDELAPINCGTRCYVGAVSIFEHPDGSETYDVLYALTGSTAKEVHHENKD